MTIESAMKEISETIQKEGNARTVFGEPMKLDNHTMVPVAVVEVGVGGGGAARDPSVVPAIPKLFGGGGLGVRARPVGFIHERDGQVVFTPIDVDEGKATDSMIPAVRRALARLTASILPS